MKSHEYLKCVSKNNLDNYFKPLMTVISNNDDEINK